MKQYDCVVIGGGFFGTTLGLFLSEYFERVVVLEQESEVFTKASFSNQARVHMGYHYPRSLVTAFRSLVNFPKFVHDFRYAIKDDFEKYYAISKTSSKVNAGQFYKIYKNMGAPISKAPTHIKELFDTRLIEDVFTVKEFAFDAKELKQIVLEKYEKSKCELKLDSCVQNVAKNQDGSIAVNLKSGEKLNTRFVFNCTYSGLNTILHNSNLPLLDLKHEITEMALIELPKSLENISVTVMDGPFFSIMPFPSLGLNTLSHVRYTPHGSWQDRLEYMHGYDLLQKYEKKSNYDFMIKDAQRYIPALKEAIYKKSIFEVKTVQVKNEIDDGRPILFSKDYGMKNFSNILGGKIDNIYEIIDTIQETKEFLGLKKKHFWNSFR